MTRCRACGVDDILDDRTGLCLPCWLTAAVFVCPRCGWTSHHPTDVAERYCGHCHDWTGQEVER